MTIGGLSLDPRGRPIVVAVVAGADEPHETVSRAKAAIGLGADLVEVTGPLPDTAARELTAAGVVWLAAATEEDEVARLVAAGAAGLFLAAETPLDTASILVPVIGPDRACRSGDWVRHDLHDLAAGPAAPADAVQLVDVTDATDPAGVAAAVTFALEFGADALRTTDPRAARRAAHVVRAIERVA